jgi:hypothetical protein
MNTISLNYSRVCSETTDINQHLPTLKAYADLSNVVVEMGVRTVCSTWAFLMSKCPKIISYDINFNDYIKYCQNICRQEGREWNFILDSSLMANIPQTDLLFVDTFHTYAQLKNELSIHHTKVNKWIICHDTESYGSSSENGTTPGLQAAINEFISSNPSWKIKEHYKNNNGLTVLEKI